MPSNTTTTQPDLVDVRGPRFAAWVTTAALVLVLIASAVNPLVAAVILAVQAIIFAIGAVGGPRKHPYGRIFATVVAPRVGPVQDREPTAPLKFAQLVGLIFAVLGTVGFATGAVLFGVIATAAALAAAFLNAAFGICLGCQLYPLVARYRRTAPPT